MPLTDAIVSVELTRPQAVLTKGIDPERDSFFSAFLGAMERYGIRYRALHFRDGMLYGTEFAVDPQDEEKLAAAFGDLRQAGFLAVQSLDLESHAHRIVFARIAEGKPETRVVDLFLRDTPSDRTTTRTRVRS